MFVERRNQSKKKGKQRRNICKLSFAHFLHLVWTWTVSFLFIVKYLLNVKTYSETRIKFMAVCCDFWWNVWNKPKIAAIIDNRILFWFLFCVCWFLLQIETQDLWMWIEVVRGICCFSVNVSEKRSKLGWFCCWNEMRRHSSGRLQTVTLNYGQSYVISCICTYEKEKKKLYCYGHHEENRMWYSNTCEYILIA